MALGVNVCVPGGYYNGEALCLSGQVCDNAGNCGGVFSIASTCAVLSNLVVASLTNGGFVAAWLQQTDGWQYMQPSSPKLSNMQVYDNEGAPTSPVLQVANLPSSIAGLKDGFLGAWLCGGNSGTSICGQLFNNTGNLVGDSFQVCDPNSKSPFEKYLT